MQRDYINSIHYISHVKSNDLL